MPPKPTVRDVARLAGVSVATVSYVLNKRDDGRARPETRERVLAAAAELGYSASFAARGLRRGRTEQVYVVPRRPGSPFAAALARDLAAVAERHGYATAMFVQGDWEGYLRRHVADGAAIDLWHRRGFDQARLEPLVGMGLALLVFGNGIEPDGFDVVRSNELQACEEAMRYLVGAGHRRIACLRRWPGEGQDDYRAVRFEAYQNVLGELPEEWLMPYTDNSWERGHDAALALLDRPDRPTAVFALSDSAGVAACWAARSLGLRVPDDVAIVAVGGVHEPATRVTFVEPDRMDFTPAADLLFDRLSDPGPGRVLFQNWSLVHRGTA
ncbi:LacI family DNA-binding transcriptional regulator [Nonomuraea endophytica]|uniref:LacI family transcriptional regulator n=1 Tax=Nonomuraea endophytica TaxID=714136 RepID=A0A7W8A7W6_9ACTN|nr:LacI family DNA-binding transcriptional regulator [Nonomuraea endophytica]MBB5079863.1 LacI family transcriptional regulator [Nonomuraea endophytica]